MSAKIKGQRAKAEDTGRLSESLAAAASRLPGSPTPRLDAEVLLGYALNKGRAWLYAHGNVGLIDADLAHYSGLVQRRAAGEPIAYITGRREFWSLQLEVTPDVLIPRPETELLVELALPHLPTDQACRSADLGTGCGCIALAIASERPHSRIVATELSESALGVARDNARRLNLNNIEFRRGHWFGALAGERFDLIVSNPPYVAADDPHLTRGDARFEPREALVAGADGLDAIRELIQGAKHHLCPGGWLLLEHGWNQRDAVQRLLNTACFRHVSVDQDLEGRPRVALAQVGNVL